jgi:predicted RNA-binding Zn-ribbon protein involved in translation (DUF1610 family)
MSKTIYCFKPTRTATPKRICLNCGKDISHKKPNVQFCSPMCRAVYRSEQDEGHAMWLSRNDYMHDVIARG